MTDVLAEEVMHSFRKSVSDGEHGSVIFRGKVQSNVGPEAGRNQQGMKQAGRWEDFPKAITEQVCTKT